VIRLAIIATFVLLLTDLISGLPGPIPPLVVFLPLIAAAGFYVLLFALFVVATVVVLTAAVIVGITSERTTKQVLLGWNTTKSGKVIQRRR
jgi:hypothetical protein